MTVLDLRPRLAASRRRRFLRRYGLTSVQPTASSVYAANLRLALLPIMLTWVWADELRRYAETMANVIALAREKRADPVR